MGAIPPHYILRQTTPPRLHPLDGRSTVTQKPFSIGQSLWFVQNFFPNKFTETWMAKHIPLASAIADDQALKVLHCHLHRGAPVKNFRKQLLNVLLPQRAMRQRTEGE